MKLLYFAWVKERVGLGEETVTPPGDVKDLAGLITWLRGRGAVSNPASRRRHEDFERYHGPHAQPWRSRLPGL